MDCLHHAMLAARSAASGHAMRALLLGSICCVLPGNESFDEYDFPPALPIMGMLDHTQDSKYAPGIQTKVTGKVLKWHREHGLQSFPAKEYIEKLERENQILKQQVKAVTDAHNLHTHTHTLSCNS